MRELVPPKSVLTILFFLGILVFAGFLTYYIFYPSPEVTNFIVLVDKDDLSSNHLPWQAFKTIAEPSPSQIALSQQPATPQSSVQPVQPVKTVNPPQPPSSSNQAPASQVNPPASTSVPSNDDLTFGAYFDDFPNSVYINSAKTTLYQDKSATAIFFPPVYNFKPAASSVSLAAGNSFVTPTFNKFNGPYNDRRCLKKNCLVQKDKTLYYNGNILELPAELKFSNLSALSISALTKTWLVGATLHDGANYRGLVFSFDGQNFTAINTPAPLTSSYFGLWGFGGEESDFLMIYGAYQGIAYRVRGNNLTDISKFFGIRAMNGGFKAEVIRAAYGANVNWYIYSSTSNNLQFLKLWQNNTSDIAGEAVFSDIFSASPQSVAFGLLNVGADKISLLARLTDTNGGLSDMIFTDSGFDNSAQKSLTTTPLSNSSLTYKIMIQKIYDVNLNLDSGSQGSVQYLFSSDGKNWQSILGRQNTDFVASATPFYLKVIFPAETNRFYSPYLDSMLFSYYWKRVD